MKSAAFTVTTSESKKNNMKQPIWMTIFNDLRSKDSRYEEALNLIQSIYSHNLRWIIKQYSEVNLDNLTSTELQVYFLENIFLKYCPLEDLRKYCAYFVDNIHGDYGLNESVSVKSLKVDDKVKCLGREWKVVKLKPVQISDGKEVLSLEGIKKVLKIKD